MDARRPPPPEFPPPPSPHFAAHHFGAPQKPSKTAAIASWLHDTPLPTTLAFQQPSDDDSSEDAKKTKKKNRKNKKSANVLTSSTIQPGRLHGGAAGASSLLKTEEERERDARIERKAIRKGTGGWVQPVGHDASTLYYNPQNPRVRESAAFAGSEAGESEARRKVNAISRKEAKALAEAAAAEDLNVDDSDDTDSDSEDLDGGRGADQDSDENSDSAMDRVRERMIQLAKERNLPDNEEDDEDEETNDEAADGTADKQFLFRRPGRAGYTPSTNGTITTNRDDAGLTAKDLLADDDDDDETSDSDYDNPLVNHYLNTLSLNPPGEDEDEQDNLALAQLISPTDTPEITTEQSEENQLRAHIYTNLVPSVQHPKTNPSGSLAAVNQIIPDIYKLSNYPADQKSLTELCMLVLERIAVLPSMTNEVVSDAQLLLANLYVQGVPNYDPGTFKPEYNRAFVLYESASKRGNVDAVFNVALCHEKGCGTSISFAKAVHNYKKAALRNHPGAMFRLGTALQTGSLGMPVNLRDGIKWLRLSAKYATKTYPHALYEYAMLHESGVTGLVYPDHEFMVEALGRGAVLGHAGCQVKLGEIYSDGLYGFKKDIGKGVYYYSLAAENGIPEGMFELGGIYLTGAHDESTNLRLDKSVQEAVRWVSLAAECNLPRALFAMGYFAEKGMSANGKTKPDEKTALLWYKKAALVGDPKAVAKLEELGIQVDWKAFRKMEAAQEKGSWGASILQLGGGVGVSKAKMKEEVALRMDAMKVRASGRHVEVDEELDGGNKCTVM